MSVTNVSLLLLVELLLPGASEHRREWCMLHHRKCWGREKSSGWDFFCLLYLLSCTPPPSKPRCCPCIKV